MHFDLLPSRCLVDHTLAIRVCGVSPWATVSMRLCNPAAAGRIFMSQAVFEADGEGVVDLARQAPVSGTYQGIDPMGLFWSRAPASETSAAACGDIGQDFDTVTLQAESNGKTIEHRIQRCFAGPGVAAHQVHEDGLVGRMFMPAGSGAGSAARAAVLVVGGSDGGLGWSREMASLLASHGYAALALAYFAMDGLPATLDRIPLEYFGTALRWLARQPGVAPGRIGVVGCSRGGELALLLGAHFPSVKAVAAYVPSGIVWPAYPASGHGAWTLGGKDVPYASTLTYEQWDAAVAEGRADPQSFDWFLIPLRDAAFVEATAIAVERIDGPVLLISGEADGIWPSSALAEFAVRRMQAHGLAHRVEHLRYRDAGHAIAWPHAPTTMSRLAHPTSGEEIDMGGTAEGTARAREDSWRRLLDFLAAALVAGPSDTAPGCCPRTKC